MGHALHPHRSTNIKLFVTEKTKGIISSDGTDI